MRKRMWLLCVDVMPASVRSLHQCKRSDSSIACKNTFQKCLRCMQPHVHQTAKWLANPLGLSWPQEPLLENWDNIYLHEMTGLDGPSIKVPLMCIMWVCLYAPRNPLRTCSYRFHWCPIKTFSVRGMSWSGFISRIRGAPCIPLVGAWQPFSSSSLTRLFTFWSPRKTNGVCHGTPKSRACYDSFLITAIIQATCSSLADTDFPFSIDIS